MNTDFLSMCQQLFTTGNFGHIMVSNFLLNTFVVWVMVHFLYYRKSRRRDFYFTFTLIGIAIYFLVFFMIFVLEDMKGKTGIGIGIGLFGIFSIMRYRTDTMPVREMTYLFSIICLSVINAMGSAITTLELLVPNAIVLVAMLVCEHWLLKTKEMSRIVLYDRIALVKPECHDQMLADLRDRTGLDITHFSIGSIDFLRDSAIVRIYYKPQGEENEFKDTVKVKREQWETVEE